MRAVFDARIIALDFDGTIGNTGAPSPNGMNVHKAYDMALYRVFGVKGILAAVGGLQNRAPIELLQDVLRELNDLRSVAGAYYRGNRARLIRRGAHLPDRRCTIEALAEAFVWVKLDILLGEIGKTEDGSIWPMPCEGVLEFLAQASAQGKKIAVISSGHELFIRKCFEMWGAPCPRYLLTDDDLRNLPFPVAKKTKPSKLLYTLLSVKMKCPIGDLQDSVYFGDDAFKDGMLAENAYVPFGWYNPEGKPAGRHMNGGHFEFRDWRELLLQPA